MFNANLAIFRYIMARTG